DLDVVPASVVRGHGLAQRRRPERLGVAEVGVREQLHGALPDGGRRPGGGLPGAQHEDVLPGRPAGVRRGEHVHDGERGHRGARGGLHRRLRLNSSARTCSTTPSAAASTSSRQVTKSASSPYHGSATSSCRSGPDGASGSKDRYMTTRRAACSSGAGGRSACAWSAVRASTRSWSTRSWARACRATRGGTTYFCAARTAAARWSIGLPTSHALTAAESTTTWDMP